VAPGLFGEPLNALTNLFFLLAAYVLARRLTKGDPRGRWDDWLLISLVALVGGGSLVFHVLATKPTSVLDKLFIGLFIWTFFHRFLTRVAGLGASGAAVGVRCSSPHRGAGPNRAARRAERLQLYLPGLGSPVAG
jgi:hypothetical protein